METSVTLQPPFPYPLGMLIVAAICLAIVVIANVLLRIILPGKVGKPELPQRKKKDVETVPYFDLNESKWRHISQLDKLLASYDMGQVSTKVAYEEISRVARSFAHEATGIDVRDYTLEELRRSPYPALAELIAICYEPEFAEHSTADARVGIQHARTVIWSWR